MYLRPHLRESTDCGVGRWSGRTFHRLGEAEQKARSPIIQSLVLGFRRYAETEQRVRVEHCGVRSCVITMDTLVGEEGNLVLNPE